MGVEPAACARAGLLRYDSTVQPCTPNVCGGRPPCVMAAHRRAAHGAADGVSRKWHSCICGALSEQTCARCTCVVFPCALNGTCSVHMMTHASQRYASGRFRYAHALQWKGTLCKLLSSCLYALEQSKNFCRARWACSPATGGTTGSFDRLARVVQLVMCVTCDKLGTTSKCGSHRSGESGTHPHYLD